MDLVLDIKTSSETIDLVITFNVSTSLQRIQRSWNGLRCQYRVTFVGILVWERVISRRILKMDLSSIVDHNFNSYVKMALPLARSFA